MFNFCLLRAGQTYSDAALGPTANTPDTHAMVERWVHETITIIRLGISSNISGKRTCAMFGHYVSSIKQTTKTSSR